MRYRVSFLETNIRVVRVDAKDRREAIELAKKQEGFLIELDVIHDIEVINEI